REAGTGPASTYGNHRYAIHVPNAYTGDALLVDPRTATVLRVLEDPVAAEFATLRTRIARYLASPSVQVLCDGHLIREDLVDGDAFPDLSSKARLETVRKLLCGYAELARQERAG